jgi:hypothetical protein
MRAIVALDNHELGEYLRVDEIASRFGVSIDDVLASCSVLGFHAHDADSLIEITQFEQAVMSAPVHPHEKTGGAAAASWRRRVLAASAAAVLVAVLAISFAPRGRTGVTPTRAAAVYEAQVKATYESAVDDSPTKPDYQTLAHQLEQITPPADLRAEHDALVAEAENVATLATTADNDVTPVDDASAAAAALREHVAELGDKVGK